MSELKPCPNFLYLQWCPNGVESTWCTDKINDDDVCYIRAGKQTSDSFDALRAEVAALEEELHQVRMNWDAALKAELKKYTEPLTDEQIVAIEKATAHLPRFGNRSDWWDMRDAAIRRVRGSE